MGADILADDLDYMMHWCLVYHGAFKKGEKLRGGTLKSYKSS